MFTMLDGVGCLEKLIYASMYKSLCIKLDQLHNLSLLGLHLQGYLNITYLKCIMCVRMESHLR